jgi:Kdo2-lipid IVA lauroyltransferase/acyltransferase
LKEKNMFYQFTLPKISLSKFLQMRLNSWLFRLLPFSCSRAYIRVLGKLYYLLNWSEKVLIRTTCRYIFRRKFAAGHGPRKIKGVFRGIFDHYHEKMFLGYSHFPRLCKFLKTRVKFAGANQLEEALAAGRGVMLVTGHFGAVEFLPGALALNGYPTSMICRFQTTRLRESMGKRAAAVGLELIDADDGNIILAAMKALKQGRILITEVDEFDEWRIDPRRGNYFLNCRLPADRTLDLLQKRSGAEVVTALMKREGKKCYTCDLTAISNGAFPGHLSLSERCLSVLEETVEAHPDQWYQWKKFGKLIQSHVEAENGHQEPEYLEPEIGLPVPDQA